MKLISLLTFATYRSLSDGDAGGLNYVTYK